MAYDIGNLRFNKLYKKGLDCVRCVISYEDHELRLTGPKMILGSDVVLTNGYYYIDLVFDPNSKNCQKFLNFVKECDYSAIAEIHENTDVWYREAEGDGVSLTQIEHEFIPTVRASTIYDHRLSFKLKVAKDKVEFFDQEDVIVPYQLLKETYKAIPLLELSAVCKDQTHLWMEWNILQLKVDLPETILSGCHLGDIDETDSEDEAFPDEEEDP